MTTLCLLLSHSLLGSCAAPLIESELNECAAGIALVIVRRKTVRGHFNFEICTPIKFRQMLKYLHTTHGSVNDARVLRHSSLYQEFEINNCQFFQEIILGDLCNNWLIQLI